MQPTRRELFKYAGALAMAASGTTAVRKALASGEGHGATLAPETRGVLVDLTECVGCRLCEFACKKANGVDPGPLASYDDPSVFRVKRRPSPVSLTVLNAWHPADSAGTPTTAPKPVYTKVNCLHCNQPACVSACIVGALEKQPNGAVTYDAWKCIGCRYCMVACPFQIPAYEYDHALTPQVKKCEFCQPRTATGQLPACVHECPRQAMTYGPREELLTLARQRIAAHPSRYQPHIYGEHEVGGTSWLYLSGVPFEQAGFLTLGDTPPSALTEKIQHGVFKHWILPISWYSFLAGMYWYTGRRAKNAHSHGEHGPSGGHDSPKHRPSTQAPTGPGGVAVLEAPPALRTTAPTKVQATHSTPTPALAHHVAAAPVTRELLTPGVLALALIVMLGVAFGLYRFIFGLASSTNLDQQHPWGLWIAMDVGSGIALAGGGFVTAALVHIFHREHYHAVARSALLTALLGYTFYVPGLLADLGRWYNLWHPLMPPMWQGNSVLFEVGLCVVIYLHVQYAELLPILCEPVIGQSARFPRLARLARLAHDLLERIMPALLVLGVALSTFHQSSLGNLLVIAPYKLHPLWWSPLSPVHFLLSAVMVGLPMVIFTLIFASWCLRRKPEMHVLTPLARYVPVVLALYLAAKVGDMVWRGSYVYLARPNVEGIAWLVEMLGGVVLPLAMLLLPRVRRSPKWLGTACLAVILGVVVNRLNVFILGYHPPYAEKAYIPSVTEMAVSAGLVAALLLTYRVAVTYLPILEPAPPAKEQAA